MLLSVPTSFLLHITMSGFFVPLSRRWLWQSEGGRGRRIKMVVESRESACKRRNMIDRGPGEALWIVLTYRVM